MSRKSHHGVDEASAEASDAYKALLPGAEKHFAELAQRHEQAQAPAVDSGKPARSAAVALAGWAGALAGPMVRYVLSGLVTTFVEKFLPQLKQAVEELDGPTIKAALNRWLAYIGGPADAF